VCLTAIMGIIVEIDDEEQKIKVLYEQIEEENMFGVLVERLERINGHWNGLYILDKELGER